jgi:hypothetical protein
MIPKKSEKEKAIQLRKEGKTYNEILKVIPVAKSTLSLWLRDVGLSKRQTQRITEKKLASIQKAGEVKRQQRILKTIKIVEEARSQIGAISDRELLLIGTVLYWAEGAKEKIHGSSGARFQFGNMDPLMIVLMIEWLVRICKIDETMIGFELYLHENHKYRVKEVQKYWAEVLDVPISKISKIYYKKNQSKQTNRKNVGTEYYGLLRICVAESSSLVRKIKGWTLGIIKGIDK